MTTSEILIKFETQCDDNTELSDQEELDLANDVYTEIQDDRPWEWLKKTATGTTSTTVPYIALPTDFKSVMPNFDNESVVFVGNDFSPYKVIPFSSRRDYRDMNGFVYIDIPNSRLYFTLQPTSALPIEYDYISVAPLLDTTSSNPLMPARFHKMIAFGMAASTPIMEQADKAKSYVNENALRFNDLLKDMAVEDAYIKLSI